jgi:hypothetical protein
MSPKTGKDVFRPYDWDVCATTGGPAEFHASGYGGLQKALDEADDWIDKEIEMTKLPTDAQARKAVPIATGVLDYFPLALAAVAEVSRVGNEQHNPGQPLHWARGKSMDQDDCLIRHFLERGTIDTDGVRHSAKVAWRALALLQLELEKVQAPAPDTMRSASCSKD